jgi:hypothetical protein
MYPKIKHPLHQKKAQAWYSEFKVDVDIEKVETLNFNSNSKITNHVIKLNKLITKLNI